MQTTKEALDQINTIEKIMELTTEIAKMLNTIEPDLERLVVINMLQKHYEIAYKATCMRARNAGKDSSNEQKENDK